MNDIPGRVLVHQVNCQGVMGAGLAKEIKTRYPRAFTQYRKFCQPDSNPKLKPGMIQMVRIDPMLWICNLAGQDRYGRDKRYTDYKAVEVALKKLHQWHQQHLELDIIIPLNMGCSNAGGDWSIVSKLIEDNCPEAKITKDIFQ